MASAAFAEKMIPLAIANRRVVRFQLALTLGNLDTDLAKGSLLFLARHEASDPWMRIAISSSSANSSGEIVRLLLDAEDVGEEFTPAHALLTKQLAATVGARGDHAEVTELLLKIGERGSPTGLAYEVLAGLGQGLDRRKQRLSEWVGRIDGQARAGLDRIFDSVAKAATSESSQVWRIPAIDFLPYLSWSDAHPPLSGCIASTQPAIVQSAAVRALSSFNEPGVATLLLTRWKQLTPPLRDEAVTVLLSRPIWHEPLIAALEKGDIPISQVSIPQRTRLAALRDEKLAERAKKVLASVALGPRKETIDRYQGSLGLKGDSARGQIVYRRECANCHKLRGEGHEVGPSLETVQHRSPQEILIHVLDPNREVSPHFLDYTVRLNDGRVLTGLIAAETDSGLTLRRAQNQEDAILRSEIDDIASSGKSLMPEGVEQKITLQEMSDLIAYLRQGT
jgi:putative heme-binding domain-containing protein